MTKESKISAEDLSEIQSAKTNLVYMRALFDKSKAEAKNAELELKNLFLHLYMKYGITANDTIKPDGEIVRTDKAIVVDQVEEKK